jgi:hypothetical protein
MWLSKPNTQFLILTFLLGKGGHFVTQTSLLFLNQHKILYFLIHYMTYFKKKLSPAQKLKKDRKATK